MSDATVPIPGPLSLGRFVDRPNRFLVRVRLRRQREPVEAHLPDPGRLRELLLPGRRVWVRSASSARRKTRWTAVLVEAPEGDGLVSVDTTLPNRLVRVALERLALPELSGWRLSRPEYAHGRSRFDFLLDGRAGHLVLEVKSVTLVDGGVALFPDAVTARGTRHLKELAGLAARDRWSAAVLFVLQRSDARKIVAARSIDAVFADALDAAREAGVRVLGRRCHVSTEAVTLGAAVPVE